MKKPIKLFLLLVLVALGIWGVIEIIKKPNILLPKEGRKIRDAKKEVEEKVQENIDKINKTLKANKQLRRTLKSLRTQRQIRNINKSLKVLKNLRNIREVEKATRTNQDIKESPNSGGEINGNE